ncbi:hypothetical protein HOR70_gp10 [Pectobacterium phage PPWS4]|uniref:Uncharacterized protein n=1 Tax=Pectobacterium phage PPWS4 TaxID=1961914 RepID=A0A250KA71_9CAUD|nr:hypothetical protein HOR70_gp10 [Pectobacterium phage PPWS4]BBA26425.1 hypothetical protein [Pectobacterium phage PPWS4]
MGQALLLLLLLLAGFGFLGCLITVLTNGIE